VGQGGGNPPDNDGYRRISTGKIFLERDGFHAKPVLPDWHQAGEACTQYYEREETRRGRIVSREERQDRKGREQVRTVADDNGG
jgi:hypothetical protein